MTKPAKPAAPANFNPNMREQPEVIQRIARALELDVSVNQVPADHTIPAVLLHWDFTNGIVRVASARQTDLEVHITYLRICDLLQTFGQMQINAATVSMQQPRLNRIGAIMAGKRAGDVSLLD